MNEGRQIYQLMTQLEASDGLTKFELAAGLSELEVIELANSRMDTIVKSQLVQISVTGEKYITDIPEIRHICVRVIDQDDV